MLGDTQLGRRVGAAVPGRASQAQIKADCLYSFWAEEQGQCLKRAIEAEQLELSSRLEQGGSIECFFDEQLRNFVTNSSSGNSQHNHIISIVPTGMVRLVDSLAACKDTVRTKGGRCTPGQCAGIG